MENCYILVGKQLLNTGIIGIFSERKDAEKQLERLEKIYKGPHVFSTISFDILEAPFNSTKVVDECIEQVRKELGL